LARAGCNECRIYAHIYFLEFPGGLLLRRWEQETGSDEQRVITKKVPEIKESCEDAELYLRCFDDIYGFRAMCEGVGKNLYYLSPWEFLMLWECLLLTCTLCFGLAGFRDRMFFNRF
jgi:hypothetical protein